ncbi:hypothetical protein [Salidesulfovibrio onnuriiensis]|uniref:hypothetical protein n=1 Tax=Salidesulfovibrio onnuriiensis TaxID=2583823 RepID=UPI0011CC9BAC|nr:hypothetical protein [Salidesulfovibrio onnuriiensis]
MRKATFLAFALLFAAFVFLAGPGTARAKTNLMFIFDASGSMWGQIDGKPKIAIAKAARTNLGQLALQRKQRVPRDALQQTLDRCVQEIHAINVTIAQGQ